MKAKHTILILYGHLEYPLRASIRDLIYCFKKYANAHCFYYSPDHGEFPEYLKKIDFDLIVYSTVFVGERWGGEVQLNNRSLSKISHLKNSRAVKIVHPQDEWIHTDTLCKFINEFNINHVFSVAPPSEWKKIYNTVDHEKVLFHEALTGYLDDDTVQKISSIISQVKERDIDVGYRAYKAPTWLGKHGYLKTQIADVFAVEAPKAGFTVDISTDNKGVILGDDWFRFMARCKYFIGVEGGSTIIDRDGAIWKKGTAYEKEHPNASFEEFERNCFPGMDGNLKLIAISPRHLEACVTKSCQVLIEGDYNHILKPGEHYIELKRDFSNLNDVFKLMKDESLRIQIAERAYNDIVLSGEYSYRNYVKMILNVSFEGIQKTDSATTKTYFFSLYNKFKEYIYWNRKNPNINKKILFIRSILVNIYIYLGFRYVKQLIKPNK